jgi:tetratricopeptide (TPR) repeat protein
MHSTAYAAEAPTGEARAGTPRARRLSLCALLLALLAGGQVPVLADTVVVRGVTYSNVKITGIRGGNIHFTAGAGDIVRPLADVSRIVIDGETAFNAAEEAFAAKNWDRATEGYERTVRTTTRPWLRDWCAIRLVESANEAGRLDAAVAGFVVLAERAPTLAEPLKLRMPAASSAYLPEAIATVNAAIARIQNNQSRLVLLKLLAELHTARGDVKAAAEANSRLIELRALVDPNSPEALRAAVLSKLRELRAALAAGQYDRVIRTVQEDSANIADAMDQAEALFLFAEARAGQAAGATDAATWKEVAVAYMRVVAYGPATSPHVPEALLRTAAIHRDHLGEKETARRIYNQILNEYKGSEAARAAEAELKKLQ